MEMTAREAMRSRVQAYYGKTLASTGDLKTSACCSAEALLARHRAILAEIEDEVLERFYGCGSPIPPALDGCTVLDLGCAPFALPLKPSAPLS